jgi:hypothetical protein
VVGEEGKPEEAAPEAKQEEAPKDNRVTVSIGGQEFLMAPEAAAAYPSERQTVNNFNHDQEQRQQEAPVDNGDEIDDLLYSDPTKFRQKMEEGIMKKMRAEYTQEQSARDFWSEFYTDHPDLRQFDAEVKASVQRHWSEVATLKGKNATKRVAELAQADMLSFVQRYKGTTGTVPDTSTSLEGGTVSSNSSAPIPIKKVDPRMSLGDSIKKRRQAQRVKR